MLLKDLFQKDIQRDIKGVIKIGQDDDANVLQELEEYVVTRELKDILAPFLRHTKNNL